MKTVAVIGSGASGLAAALAAAQGGARVTVYEQEERLGGTTALSGGNAWLPGHDELADDSPELGLAYLRALSLGDADDEVLQVFAREAGPTAARLQRDTAIRLQPIPYCDYHAEFEGGREQGGRTLEPQPYDPRPEVAEMIRDAPERDRADHLRRARGRRHQPRAARRASRAAGRSRWAARCSPACSRRASTPACRSRPACACASGPSTTRSSSPPAASSATRSWSRRSCAARCWRRWARRARAATASGWRSRRARCSAT